MRGASHWRPADVDVATCRRHSIAVAALDEEGVGLYRYQPLAVLAALFDLGVEVAGSTDAWSPETVRRCPTWCRRSSRLGGARAGRGAGDRRPREPVRRREGRRRAG